MRGNCIVRLLTSVALVLLTGGTAMANEEPRYEVISTAAEFEVRRYAPVLIAETEVSGEYEGAMNEAFRLIAGFIFGKNESQQKIAMTTPVTQQRSEKIAMTTPVTQERIGNAWKMTFYMPSKYTKTTLPRPIDDRVKIRELPARVVAAHRFSGRAREENFREAERALRSALARSGIAAAEGDALYAVYNAPWTPPFLRRNEVLIPVRQ